MLVVGNAQAIVRKVALTHGFLLVPDVQAILKEPDKCAPAEMATGL